MHIAKVLDAGATEQGRPFFVMELVKGIPATRYCDENKLDTRQRLDLFIQICQAVQHAHQKGIIHRDIKPSNVLVADHDGTPVPKVIDFGIAKATTDQRLTDKTLFTAFEQFIGTPAYMSPEQAKLSGLDIDTRSDIYSLGVLLYELLTGKTPFDARRLLDAGFDEIRRIIREEEPQRPSTRLSTLEAAEQTDLAKQRQSEPPKLVGSIRGDLDWIVMKCLEKDRTRRYETANGLAADVQRHLTNEPVVACPPSAAYRFQKMVRRNKAAFALATSIASVVVIGLSVSTWLMHKQKVALERALAAEQAQKRSDQEKQLAETMNQVLLWWPSIVEMVVSHDNPEALVQLESNLRKVVAMSRQLDMRTNETYLDALQKLIVLLKDREDRSKNVELKAEIVSLGGEAEAFLKNELAEKRKHFGDVSIEIAEAKEDLAALDSMSGKPTERIDLLRESLAIRQTLKPGQPWEWKTQWEQLARTLRYADRLDEVVAMYRDRLNSWKPTYHTPEHTNCPFVGCRGDWTLDLAYGLVQQGKLEEAEHLCRELLSKVRDSNNVDPENSCREELGEWYEPGEWILTKSTDEYPPEYKILEPLEKWLRKQGKTNEADRVMMERVEVVRFKAAPQAKGRVFARTIIQMLGEGKHAEIEPLARELLTISKSRNPGQWYNYTAESFLGMSLAGQGKSSEAEPLLLSALAGMKKCIEKGEVPDSTGPIRVHEALDTLVKVSRALGKSEASDSYSQQLAAWDKEHELRTP